MSLHTKATGSSKVNQRELDNRRVAYLAATEGIVLLKNDGCLPVLPGKLALYGAGAAYTIKGGTGSGEVNERKSVTILEGLEKVGFEVTTKQWLYDYEMEYRRADEEFAKMVAKRLRKLDLILIVNPVPFRYPFGRSITQRDIEASDTDTCVYVVSRQSGECGDRDPGQNDYTLSEIERENIRTAAAAYKKTIVVINAGSSMDVRELDDIPGIGAVIYFCQQGCEGGTAFADILSGSVTPSGKLTDTWAKSYADLPFGEEYAVISGNRNQAAYKEGIYVGYRYFDSFGVSPQYPFGYGLSYTDFAVSKPSVTIEGTKVRVGVSVKNTGDTYNGKEILQLYVSCPGQRLEREKQSLAAFAKTETLKPGEVQKLELAFDLTMLAAYDVEHSSYLLEVGEYALQLGTNSRDTSILAILTLDADLVVSVNKNICLLDSSFDILRQQTRTAVDYPDELPRLVIDRSAFTTRIVDYSDQEEDFDPAVTKLLDTLHDREMADLAVGIGMFGGKTHFTVPGAGGNTTSALVKKGLANIALCDGPAGLRVQKTSVVTKNGAVKMVDAQLGAMEYLPKFVKKFLFGDPKKGSLIYQFATAFPVGNALAQSWNIDLLERVGSAVGREMEEYGISVWLAPGMNIHRNPLCGRNFEYYSEDPLLSGKMAAAMTRGVQSHRGYFVTLKHFACNNQEENRQRASSNLEERSLREIYLRGFEIAVRESQPGCVMSSYNLINGVYAPNNHDLLTKVLRNEWGFSGLVMTDWLSTWRRMKLASNPVAIASGNDLIMPGGGSFKKDILKGLKTGTVTRKQLRTSCGRIIRLIHKTRIQEEYI